jgi:OmpA-OmpF porin, OOP family
MRLAPTQGRVLGAVLLGFFFPGAALAAHSERSESETSETTEDDEGPTDYRFEFGLFGGGHFFDSQSGLGRATDSPDDLSPHTAGTGGGRLALNFNAWVSLEGEALWVPTRTVRNPDGTNLNIFAYRGSLVVHLIGHGPFRPFLLAGYGAMTSVSNDETVVPSDTDGILHAGAGFKIGFGEHVGLRLEGRVMAPPAFLGNRIPIGDELGYHGPDWEALGGLYLAFGEVEKVRKVVINRVKETVVQQARPNPDPDGDGIAGSADKCPNLAEDKDGFEDEDGCPDPDNDKDGIPDAQDKCPNKPETVNTIDDEDGCPEVDTDGDGFLGSRDKCPDEPETRNGYKDDDGCPDEVPTAVKKFTGVIEGINFKSGKATILVGSYALLDRAVTVLKEYPEIRLEISGHTDSRGKADYNRDLSQRRADAVRGFFIASGIDAGRLTAIGYGADRPLADNGTDSGRARNRRTEFRLLMPDEGKGSVLEGKPAPVPAAPEGKPPRP